MIHRAQLMGLFAYFLVVHRRSSIKLVLPHCSIQKSKCGGQIGTLTCSVVMRIVSRLLVPLCYTVMLNVDIILVCNSYLICLLDLSNPNQDLILNRRKSEPVKGTKSQIIYLGLLGPIFAIQIRTGPGAHPVSCIMVTESLSRG